MKEVRVLLGILAITVFAFQALAGQTDPADGEIKLGPIQGFANEATARQACEPDGVVWADRRTGFYYPKFVPDYGVSPTGAFTCYKQAKRADYWGFGTASSMASKRARVFPFSPGPFCDYKVDKTGKGFCAQPGV